MEIVLARHGRTNENDEGKISGDSNKAQLTKQGKEHAEHLAEIFKNEKFEAIFCSPLNRAIHTAEPISKKIHIPIKKEKLLTEIHFGVLDGTKQSQVQKNLDEHHKDLFLKFPKGESYLNVLERAKKFLKVILAKKYKRILIVGHHGINRAILIALLEVDISNPRNMIGIAQSNPIVYEVDTDKKICTWINTHTKETGKGLLYKKD